MNMLPGRLYNPRSHAALMEWRLSAVGSDIQIFIAQDACALFKAMRDTVTSYANELIEEHWETIACSDLDALYEQFIDDTQPAPETFGSADVGKLLVRLMNDHGLYMMEHPQELSIRGEWSQLLDLLNDLWGPEDCLYICVEGRIPEFALGLIRFIESARPKPGVVELREGRWLKTLRDIANSQQWWTRTDLGRLSTLMDELNNHYRSC